ncbi:uncharacterized protein LOC116385375 [Anarrhichthys ocellatus]|uniref:uncharacterized protein LOC116385375 n=1 Tax=Anarrhichthys ocellatus TaxID=433405 RepID=UPI0012EDA0F6|nr:uncharacterized protein LOC116385375 [Anarrhichthys ocellatus]
MNNFTLITALSLCSFCWMSVSVSQCQTVEVQAGGEVTLLSANTSTYDAMSFWFRLVNRSKASCISVMFNSVSKASYCEGFENGKFDMTANITTLSLKIKEVDSSDSGLYFCGVYAAGRLTFNVIHLNVEECSREPHDDGDSKCKTTKLTSVILTGLTVLLVMVVIGLVVRNRKLQTANEEEQNPEQTENLGSDDLNYAAVTFQTKAKRRAPEPNVIYAATR